MLYEIINPSDAYGIEGDFLPCAVAVLMLGTGQYGLKPFEQADNAEEMPLMVFGGADRWLEEHGITDLNTYIRDNRIALAEVLDTVVIDPSSYSLAKSCLPDGADMSKFREQWHDKHRTSMNDIGGRARVYSEYLREEASATA